MSLEQALTIVKAAGFRVSKPRAKKVKDRVGPTFHALFADGTTTRMSTFTSLTNLDHGRGERLSRAAWANRRKSIPELAPKIVSAHFEQDGLIVASFEDGEWIGLKAA